LFDSEHIITIDLRAQQNISPYVVDVE